MRHAVRCERGGAAADDTWLQGQRSVLVAAIGGC